MYRHRPGFLEGLLRLFLINTLFSWLQRSFGFGRGGAAGCGCGMIIFVIAACVIIGQLCSIDWLRLFVVGLFGA
jgi:hypothetical protein